MLQVTLVGFGKEMAEVNPERLTYTEDFGKAIASLNGDLASTIDALRQAGVDVLDGRLRNIAGDAWAPHVLLIAPSAAEDTEGLEQLLTAMRAQRSRTAVALVLADDPDHADGTGWQLTIDAHGTLRIPALDVELIAQQIPAEEAAQLAQMLALAASTEDRPVPDAVGDKPWDEYSDAAGSLRHSLTTSPADLPETTMPTATRSTGRGIADIPALHLADSAPWVTNSVLPRSPQTYLDQTATTKEDLGVLAPHVDEATRAQVESIDSCRAPDGPERRGVRGRRCACRPGHVTAQGSLPRNQGACCGHRDRRSPRGPAEVGRDLRHRHGPMTRTSPARPRHVAIS
jgi:hypothetical protein